MSATLRALAALLDYPEAALQAAIAEIRQAIAAEGLLDAGQIERLQPLLDKLAHDDLIECQEHYVELFDRGRSCSLHLFEHVHGESRDRGQALVDLRNRYLQAGLEPLTHELPDYLPLFLEYCSTLAADAALSELAEPGAILALLAGRLTRRGTVYAAPLVILCELAGIDYAPAVGAATPDADTSLEALDSAWEEQAVSFSGPAVSAGEMPCHDQPTYPPHTRSGAARPGST